MSSQLGQGRSRERNSLAFIHHSYEQVAAAFEGFEIRTDSDGFIVQGGNIRANKNPRGLSGNDQQKIRSPDYRVESIFNPTQSSYIALCAAGLHKLGRGEHLISGRPGLTTLSGRIQSQFIEPAKTHMRFGLSVTAGVVSLFNDFVMLYPNLTPALAAMGKAGGSEGGMVAALACSMLLKDALRGTDGLQRIKFVEPYASARDFTSIRPYDAPEKSHEIWCPGEAIGKTIIRQANDAAHALATIPKARAAYNFFEDMLEVSAGDIRTQLEASMQRTLPSVQQ